MILPRSSALLLAALLALAVVAPRVEAASKQPRKKTVTYLVNLKVDGRTVSGPFASTETVTAQFVANPAAGGDQPTAWAGEGTLNFGPILNTGLPGGCTLTNTPPTGTMKTSVNKTGGSIEVNWSTNSTPVGAGLLVCQGSPAPFVGAPAVEPFLLLEPKQFTIAETGAAQQLKGTLTTAKGMAENTGTLTVTKREECEPKVQRVTTHPPGQETALSNMAGRGFSPGEKLTADTNVEFTFPDGSIMRLAKGASYKESADCGGFEDKSKSYKGTLLLGKIWWNIVETISPGQDWQYKGGRSVTGRRGTRFWMDITKTRDRYTVARGSLWVRALSRAGRLTGPKVIVKAGYTATVGTDRKVVVRRSRPSDAFPFGAGRN